MSAPKAARLIPRAVDAECPYCGAGIVDPVSGSFMWDMETIEAGQIVQCDNCFKTVRIPVKVVEYLLAERQ